MSKIKIWVLVVIGLAAGIFWYSPNKVEEKPEDNSEITIDSLNNVILQYKIRTVNMDDQLVIMYDSLSHLKYLLNRDQQIISNLKKQQNEKVNAVSNYDATDLYKFLSDRYKDTTSTK